MKRTMRQQKQRDRSFWSRSLTRELRRAALKSKTDYSDQTHQDFCQAIVNMADAIDEYDELQQPFAIFIATQPKLFETGEYGDTGAFDID